MSALPFSSPALACEPSMLAFAVQTPEAAAIDPCALMYNNAIANGIASTIVSIAGTDFGSSVDYAAVQFTQSNSSDR